MRRNAPPVHPTRPAHQTLAQLELRDIPAGRQPLPILHQRRPHSDQQKPLVAVIRADHHGICISTLCHTLHCDRRAQILGRPSVRVRRHERHLDVHRQRATWTHVPILLAYRRHEYAFGVLHCERVECGSVELSGLLFVYTENFLCIVVRMRTGYDVKLIFFL